MRLYFVQRLLLIFFVLYIRWELKFIRSEFRGQLPKPYSAHPNATKIIPTDMNDMNKEEKSRYVSEQNVELQISQNE